MQSVYRPSADAHRLRGEVRAFVESWPGEIGAPTISLSGRHDREFSRALAERGWVGMALPKVYGGQECSAEERWVVIEELLAAGAPVGAHWIADRQTGPMIARVGSDELKQRFLPAIASGTCFFSIGMSEPDAGSDLASVKTRAVPVEGGWRVTGTKIWTSGADKNDFMVALVRTRPMESSKHQGLSQMVIDLRAEGVQVRPIRFMGGTSSFNEVHLTDVFVPGEFLLGEEGAGWRQVTAELANERGGPDRYMSVVPLLRHAVANELVDPGDPRVADLLSRIYVLRRLSHSIAVGIDRREDVEPRIAVVKDLGTTFERDTVTLLRRHARPGMRAKGTANDALHEHLVTAIIASPSYTIRGGTNEILRNVLARKLVTL